MVTYLKKIYFTIGILHLDLTICLLFLTRFGLNFKVSFMGPSLTDVNSHRDICQKFDPIRTIQLSKLHLPTQHLSWWYLSISAKSHLLLTQFWPNFKVSFLAPTLTDVNCLGDICPSNIWPGNIWGHVYQMPFVGGTFGPNIFGGLNVFGPKTFLNWIIFWPKFWWTKIFLHPKFFFDLRIF